jgi:putative peptidoglycan lipid II flippase
LSLDYKNIGVLFSLNTINIVLNILYTVLTVYFYGTSAEVEAFFSASVLGTAISRFVQTGQLVETIVPRYHKVKTEIGQQEAMTIISVLCNYMAGIALIMVVVFILSNDLIVNLLVPGFKESTKHYVYSIFCVTGFLMPFQIATNLFQGMLNAENIYGKVEFTNTISLILTILILLFFGSDVNVTALVAGLIISVLMQFLTTLYYLRQIGYKHKFWLQSPYFSYRELLQAITATTAYMIGVQVYTFIFNAALSFLPAGIFAIYRYAEIIYGKVANIFMIPISTVFFNDINRFVNQNKGDLVKDFVTKNLNLSYFVGFLIILPFWAGGAYFIWTIWGGVKFSAANVQQVYELLCVFFASMIVMNPYMLFRKLAVAVTRADMQYYLWAGMHIVSGCMGYLLIHWLGFNGLMLQVFVHNLLMASVPVLTVFVLKREYFALYESKEVLKITISLCVGGVVGWIGMHWWGVFTEYSKISSLLVSIVLALMATLSFVGVSLLLKVKELEVVNIKIRKWLR